MDSDTFPARLSRARKARGLTQVQLARKAALASDMLVSRYERGAQEPRTEALGKLADALGVSLDWLARGGAVPKSLRTRRAA